MMKKVLALALLVGSTLTMYACNTTEGVGKDMERGGQKIQDEANEHR